MPIYEYVCKTCGERFEIKQKFSDPPITTCADFSCEKGEPVEKIISAPAIMFKGNRLVCHRLFRQTKRSIKKGTGRRKVRRNQNMSPVQGEEQRRKPTMAVRDLRAPVRILLLNPPEHPLQTHHLHPLLHQLLHRAGIAKSREAKLRTDDQRRYPRYWR